MDKIRRTRRIAAIAIGTVKAIFRSGSAWGTARTRLRTAGRPQATAGARVGAVAGAAAGAAGAFFLDPQNGTRRRHVAFDRARALLGRDSAAARRNGS
jgi:hypothetical protein